MNDLIPFTYQGTNVRTVLIDDEPWFVLTDLCKVLEIRNARDVAARLADDMKGVGSIDTLGGTQRMTIVSEAGMYAVIMRSDKPQSEPFRRWVTSEVLPQIRRTGTYGQPRELTEDQIVHQALQISARRVKQLEAENAELTPRAHAWDHIVSSAGSWSYEEAAKVLFEQGVVTIGQKRLVAQLIEWGYLYRDAKRRPHVYQRFLEQGLFVTKARVYTDQTTGETRESSAPQVRITGKGLDMLFHRFRTGQLEVAA